MKIMMEIPDYLIDTPFGYMDIRLHKDGAHINSITTATEEKPYFTFLDFAINSEENPFHENIGEPCGNVVKIIRCKDCKHFEYDHWEKVNGIPLIVAHEICTRISDGVKVTENGYCFLAEAKDGSENIRESKQD